MNRVLARWESGNGKYWVELYLHDSGSYGYTGQDCGGNFGYTGVVKAFEEIRKMIDSGYFLPDTYKTGMRQIF